MNLKIWVMVVQLISAIDGEPLGKLTSEIPMTIEECNHTLIERGGVLAKDGVAQFSYCEKAKGVET